jgi:DNA helicase-2/ATP-dependent DNA helicase PcrA
MVDDLSLKGGLDMRGVRIRSTDFVSCTLQGKRERLFIDEFPDDLVERQGSAPGIATVRSYRAPGSGFSPVTAAPRATEPVAVAVGDDVVHASFGEGVVIGSEPGGVIVIRFAADGSERKLMAEYAPITRR